MIVEDFKDELLDDYVSFLNGRINERVKIIDNVFSNTYSGKALFQYEINEEVLKDILKNEYGIDG